MEWYTRPNWKYTFAILSGIAIAIAIAHSQLLFNVVEIPSWNHLWYAFKTKHHHEFGWFVFVFSLLSSRFNFAAFLRSLDCIKVHVMHYRLCMWVSMKCFIIFKYKTHFKHHKIIFRANTKTNFKCVSDILIFHFPSMCARCTVHSITTWTCSNW